MQKSAMIIINPSSGKAKAAEYEDEIRSVLQEKYDDIEVKHTEGEGDATRFAEEAGQRDFDLVVCLGGDGTVNETVNGLAGCDDSPVLGIIPMGTVNDFARALDIPLVPEKAITHLGNAKPRTVDIGKVNDRYFNNIVAVGNIATAIHDVSSDDKSRFGPFAYLVASAKELMNGETFSISLEIDSQKWTGDVSQVVVALTSSLGGFKLLFPDAEIDDGRLHVLVIKKLDLPEVAKITPAVLSGQLAESENTEYFQAKAVKITAESNTKLESDVDGEHGPRLPLEVQVMPGHLKVLAGPDAE